MDFQGGTSQIKASKPASSPEVSKPQPKNHFDHLDLVKAPGAWGVYASDGPVFSFAIFGRDALVVAEDILSYSQKLVKEIILTLAKLQGTKYDKTSEEELGKIHHEYRAESFDSTKTPPSSLETLHNLQKVWGGVGTNQMVYYGAYDPTLLYVRLVGDYVRRYGRSIMDDTYTGQDNNKHDIAHAVRLATNWIVKKAEDSSSGLIEYKRINPIGLLNQAWKDSNQAYLTSEGQLPNFDSGIASIELQGYAYDALQAAAYLLAENKVETKKWLELARVIQAQTLELLWMEGQQFFAQGLFYDANGDIKLIDTLTSNGGLILDSKLIYSLPEQQSRYYTEAIAKKLFSTDFLTDVGIRSRGLRHLQVPGAFDYHGSYTVWPKETNAISRGLRQSGLHALSRQLETRLINAILMTSNFYQFYYVELNGNIWYNVDEAVKVLGERFPGSNPPKPEPHQAWTISAAIRITNTKLLRKNVGAGRFEKALLKDAPNIELITNVDKIVR